MIGSEIKFNIDLNIVCIYMHIDQKNGVGIVTGSRVGTVNVVRVMNEGETMIVGAGIVIGTMIETVDMTETGTETLTVPAPTIQEVVGGPARDLESVLEIMIVIGTTSLDCFLITFSLFPSYFYNML